MTHENEAIKEAFVAGINSVDIRQRLLECTDTDLDSIHKLARSLEVAKAQAQTYISSQPSFPVNAALPAIQNINNATSNNQFRTSDISAALPSPWKCFNCGGTKYHKKFKCPAKNEICGNCGKKGHIELTCRAFHKRTRMKSNCLECIILLPLLQLSPRVLAKSLLIR